MCALIRAITYFTDRSESRFTHELSRVNYYFLKIKTRLMTSWKLPIL